ncbi:cytochrome P450, partial [Ascobolus immersus RN42]
RANKARAAGCRDPIRIGTSRFFGFRTLQTFLRAAKNHAVTWFFVDSFKQYGNTYKMKMFGAGDSIFTIEPDNIKAVLATDFEHFDLQHRYLALKPVFGDGIFNADGERWKYARGLLRPQFVKKTIANLSKIERHFQSLFTRISKDIKDGDIMDGGKVDLQPLFLRLALDSSTDFLLGYSANSLLQTQEEAAARTELPKENAPYKYGFMEAFDKTNSLSMLAFRLGALRFLVHWRKDFRECKRIVHTFFETQIDRGIQLRKELDGKTSDAEGNYDNFLQALLSSTDDRLLIRDQLTNILLAGRDTTSAVLSFTLFILARHQPAYNKLRSEVLAAFGRDTSNFSFQSLKSCTYLQWVLNEVLRLYPAVPTNRRNGNADLILPTGGGPDGKSPIFCPKGTQVYYVVFALHRRKDIYGSDADEFVPERWDSTKRKLPVGWEYLPFNGGPRICIGQQYALTEIAYIVARLLQVFERV